MMRIICNAGWLLALALFGAGQARADLVTDWSLTAARTVAPMGVAGAPTPAERVPNYAVDLATVHVAVFDAVNAFERRYHPFAAVPDVPLAGASHAAAVSEAAYRVLVTLYPSRSALYAADYQARLAAVVDATARARGQAVGADVAAQVLAWRANDGRETPAPWVNGTQPGEFQTAGTPLVNLTAPSIRPFTLRSASQFRPDGPPALGSERYARDFNETRFWGVADASSPRSAAQDDLAKFHTEAPPVFWPRNLVRFARSTDLLENARTLAVIWVAQADATIGCFEAKYHYNFWRPRTAIPAAASDGNDHTAPDAGWLPNEPTPNHPEYPAAHSCAAGAAMEVVRQLADTKKVDFFIDSAAIGVIGTRMDYQRTDDFVKDIKKARILGGMHFRAATDDGTALGRSVARWVLRHRFQRVDD